MIAQSERGGTEYYDGLLKAWHYENSLRAGDFAGAEGQRQRFSRELDESSPFTAAGMRLTIVWKAIEYGQLDAAAAELEGWASALKSMGVDTGFSAQQSVRNLLSSQLKFLEQPQGIRHPSAPRIAAQARAIAAEAPSMVMPDQARSLARLPV